jgi:uncharacterized RDD family membrane protein YckC
LSTSAAIASSSWKQEVNRRVAEHKNHKGSSVVELAAPLEIHHGASSRAAEAAARVAARYAKAPSYSEVLADEARAAVRAAEAASKAALKAQAAAESVLAGLEAASAAEPAWEPEPAPARVPERRVEPAPAQARPAASRASQAENYDSDRPSFAVRWEPDMPVRQAASTALHATLGAGVSAADLDDGWREQALPEQDELGGEGVELVEPAQPIHANLIEFPRELVATRKVRPRLAEGPYAESGEPGAQLSIFEVDPGTVSTQPAAADPVNDAVAPAWAGAEWTGPKWSGIELDAQSIEDLRAEEEALEQAEALAVPELHLAPMSLRLMAIVVNGTLIAGACLVAALMAAHNAKELPALREIEIGAAAALVIVGALYQALFFTLASATPGMKYAHISLCTLDGQIPTRAQRCGRLFALLLSLLPLGLGIAWAVFDDDHLCWHDRLSRTYMRRY